MALSHRRNHLYLKYIVGEHGTLRCCVRVRAPECVVNFIRNLCPRPSGVYAVHRDIGKDGEEKLENNESFEGVLPQGQMGGLNFDDGTKVKVCVSFENSIHPISHIQKFVSECNVPGRTVTFVGELHECYNHL